MRRRTATAIWNKVKRRFFRDYDMSGFSLEIVQEPEPNFDGKTVFVDAFFNHETKTVHIKSWVLKLAKARYLYSKFIHELTHAITMQDLNPALGVYHSPTFASEWRRRIVRKFKKRKDLVYVLKREEWWMSNKFVKATEVLKVYGLSLN